MGIYKFSDLSTQSFRHFEAYVIRDLHNAIKNPLVQRLDALKPQRMSEQETIIAAITQLLNDFRAGNLPELPKEQVTKAIVQATPSSDASMLVQAVLREAPSAREARINRAEMLRDPAALGREQADTGIEVEVIRTAPGPGQNLGPVPQ